MKKNCKDRSTKTQDRKSNQEKRKQTKCHMERSCLIVYLIAGLIKLMLNKTPYIKISQYCPKQYESFGGNINVNPINPIPVLPL